MKLVAAILSSLILAACGGGDETRVASVKTSVPHPVANAATVTGASGVAVHLYQALYGAAPSNAMLLDYTTQAAADPSAFARNLANNFASTSSTALAKLVLDNLHVTAATVTAVNGQGQSEYAILLDALGQMFTFYGADARGQIILNATNLLAGLESDATYGVTAVSYNNQTSANYAYSSNPANTVAAAVPPSAPTPEVWRQVGISLGTGLPNTVGATSIIMPEVVQVSTNLYRMYYGQSRPDQGWDIRYAESADALTFTPKGIALAGTTTSTDLEFMIRGASMVHLADGRWRMYYQATSWFDETWVDKSRQPVFQTMSAISADGVNFTREGVRIGNRQVDPNSLLWSAAHGRILALPAGGYRAWVSGTGAPPQMTVGIWELSSTDGLTFNSPRFLTEGHDPYVVQINGGYLAYIDTSNGGQAKTLAEFASNDGLTWSNASTANFQKSDGTQQPSLSDVGGIVMPNGKLRLYTNFQGGSIAAYDRITP